MGRTVWEVVVFLENCGFVHYEANTIQDFSCSLVARGDVGPRVATHTHRPLGFPGTSRNRWCCFRTKVLVFPDTPPLLLSGFIPTGSTPWKRPTEAPPPRFGPTKNKAADQPLTAFRSECSPEPPVAHLTSQNVPTHTLVGVTGKIDEAAHRTFRTFSTRPGVNLRTGHSPQNRATLQVAAMILRNHREALREGASISDQFLLSTR